MDNNPIGHWIRFQNPQTFVDSLPVLALSDLPERDQDCHICVEPYTRDAEEPVRLPCKHILGRDCLLQWLTSTNLNNNTCPVCRAILFDELDHSSRIAELEEDWPEDEGLPPLREAREYNRRTGWDLYDYELQLDRMGSAWAEQHRDHMRSWESHERLHARTVALREESYALLDTRTAALRAESDERLHARTATLRERTDGPAVSLTDQEGVRQIDRDRRPAGFSEHSPLDHDYPDRISYIPEIWPRNIRNPRAEGEEIRDRRIEREQDMHAELARGELRAHVEQVDDMRRTHGDGLDSHGLELLDENERHRVRMLIEQGIALERRNTIGFNVLSSTEPLVRQLHLQNRALSPLRDPLMRAGAAQRLRGHDPVQRLGLPPLRPTVAREEASGGRSDRFMTFQQSVSIVSERADRVSSAAGELVGRIQFDAETRPRSRPRAGAEATRHRAERLNESHPHVERTLADAEQQELPATERLNRIDTSSNIPGISSNLNVRRAQFHDSVVASRHPEMEGSATRSDTPLPCPFSTPTPAARVSWSQTPFPLNATAARMHEPAARPQRIQQPQARHLPHQHPSRVNHTLPFTLPRFEARTQQHQQTRPTAPMAVPHRQRGTPLQCTLPRFDGMTIGRDAPFTSVADPFAAAANHFDLSDDSVLRDAFSTRSEFDLDTAVDDENEDGAWTLTRTMGRDGRGEVERVERLGDGLAEMLSGSSEARMTRSRSRGGS